MIVEIAQLVIRPGQEAEFEAVFPTAAGIVAASAGYVSHELRRSIETPNHYVLMIRWRTLEDHTIGFRGSPAFPAWRARVGPFFEQPPAVEHYRLVHES